MSCLRICSISAGVKRGFASECAASRIRAFLLDGSSAACLVDWLPDTSTSVRGLFGCRIVGCIDRKHVTQSRYVAIMLGQRAAEKVPTLVVGNKIEIVGRGRHESGPQRSLAGIGDRSWREPTVLIGIIGRINAQVLGVDIFDRTAAQGHGVLHGWIALQRIAETQTIVEDACNER